MGEIASYDIVIFGVFCIFRFKMLHFTIGELFSWTLPSLFYTQNGPLVYKNDMYDKILAVTVQEKGSV